MPTSFFGVSVSYNNLGEIKIKVNFRTKGFRKYQNCENHDYTGMLKRGRSLFVIVPTAPSKNYERFTEQVRKFNTMHPFKFSTSYFFEKQQNLSVVSFFFKSYESIEQQHLFTYFLSI